MSDTTTHIHRSTQLGIVIAGGWRVEVQAMYGPGRHDD